jgi:adenosylcobinamide kinase / adenosylcobinamide-phosphate guanylyltransferase
MMPNGLTVLVGGARSGKSDLAVRLGRAWDGPVVFVATAERIDADIDARIERHIVDRPAWPTIEEPIELKRALGTATTGALVIVDCLTVWVSNLMRAHQTSAEIIENAHDVAACIVDRSGPTIVVTNEVGLGVHPETELGRDYRDTLGWVNAAFVTRAQRALLLVAGRALPLVDPLEGLL